MRLILKIFLPLIVIFLVFIAYTKWAWLPKLTKFTVQQNTTQLQVHLKSIGESLVPFLLQAQLANIHDTLDSLLMTNPTWLQLELLDQSGMRLYPITLKPLAQVNEKHVLLYQSIKIDAREIANIKLVVDISADLAAINLLEQKFFLAVLILLTLIAISVAVLVEFIISRPLAQLAQASKDLAQDDYSVALPKARDDEVGHLIHHFDSMRNALKNYRSQVIQEIEEHKNTAVELVKQKERFAYHAAHDALTGLINRREFEARLSNAIDRARKDTLEHTVFFIDLDRFKIVNDSCGHLAGDELLKQVSVHIKQNIRSSDSVARLGVDEFAVLLEFCTSPVARKIVATLHNDIQDFVFEWHDRKFNIGASIGVTSITRQTATIESVLANADQACYAAKKKGRNRIHFYNTDNQPTAYAQLESESVSRILKALENDHFILYGQPIVAALSVPTVWQHFEVLIRMQDDAGDIIMPGDFIPVAERYNLMTKVDRWVIKNAFKTLMDTQLDGAGNRGLSINLSGPSMSDTELLPFIGQQLRAFGVNPSDICFEITETAAISELTNAQMLIGELKAIGCKFALDDFGSGFSSFAYLKTLPVDYLKIDGVFVRDIESNPISEALLKSIHNIGKVFGMKTIAEFVENDIIMKKIIDIGVDYAQGFGIAKPSELTELLTRYQNHAVTDAIEVPSPGHVVNSGK